MKRGLSFNSICTLVLFIIFGFILDSCFLDSTDNKLLKSDSLQTLDSIKSKEGRFDSLLIINYYNNKKAIVSLSKLLLSKNSHVATKWQYSFEGKIYGDTTLFDITVDTLLYPNDTTCLVLYKFIESGEDPCSHAEGSRFQLGNFKLVQNKFTFLKLSKLLSTWGPWCDRPELTLLKSRGQNYILFIANDGHSGHFRNYVTVVSANLVNLGKCFINFESPSLSEKIDFFTSVKKEIEPSELERTTSYQGTFIIDSSELRRGLVRFVNEFYVIKSYGWPAQEIGDTILRGNDLREYFFISNNVVLKKQIIKSPKWAG